MSEETKSNKFVEPKPAAWKQFPEKILMHKARGASSTAQPTLGHATDIGDLQAEYVLNNVKVLTGMKAVLEDVE